MLGWGIALMVVGVFSFILPFFGKQFALVTLLGLTGMGGVVAGMIFFIVGCALFSKAIKKEKESISGNETTVSEPIRMEETSEIFRVGDASLFKGEFLSAKEFGKEIARLGLSFGDAQSKAFFEQQEKRNPKAAFLIAAKENQDFFILTFSALICGAFTCYSQLLLKASEASIKGIRDGLVEGTGEILPGLSDNVMSVYVGMTIRFSSLLLKETAQESVNDSTNYFIESVAEYYKAKSSDEELEPPKELREYLSGLGSRFMAVCQDEFKISIVRY